MPDSTPDAFRKGAEDILKHRRDSARKEGQRILGLPENAWAAECFRLYFDCKDFLRCGPADLSPYCRDAMRAIREGSAGALGNPPLM